MRCIIKAVELVRELEGSMRLGVQFDRAWNCELIWAAQTTLLIFFLKSPYFLYILDIRPTVEKNVQWEVK
jgi:hypothetical protein